MLYTSLERQCRGPMKVLLLAACVILTTFSWGRALGESLLASAGIAGIAARPTLENLLAGIQLAITQPISIEDAVIVENDWGWIEEITVTYIVVRTWDLRRLVSPLSYFIEKPFQNWTCTSPDLPVPGGYFAPPVSSALCGAIIKCLSDCH